MPKHAVKSVVMMAILKWGVTIMLAKRVASLLDELSSKIQVPEVLLTEDLLSIELAPLLFIML